MKNIISVKNLALLREQRLLFKELNFTLQEGKAIHLTGSNGSGKTSLFKILTGTLPPSFGELTIFNKNFTEFETEDWQNIFYLGHQNPIKPQLTVIENLRLNSTIFDSIKATNKDLENALIQVNLLPYQGQTANKLSAGQKRRISLARLWLIMNDKETHKKLWLLDEPLTALDVDFVKKLEQQIAKHLQLGGSIIFTSHQPLSLSTEVQLLDLTKYSYKEQA